MICKNCGAEFEEASGICPYCGREDANASKERYNKKLKGLLKQRESIQNLPNTITRNVSKKLWQLLLALAVVFVIAIIIVSVVVKQENKKKIADEQSNLEYYEQLLTEKKYDELYTALNNASSTYGYQKYVEVSGVYYSYKQVVKYCDYYEDDKHNNRPEDTLIADLGYIVKNLAKLVNNCDDYVNDNKHLGNDSYLNEIKTVACDYASKHIGMNESILSRACEIAKEANANYDAKKAQEAYDALAKELLGN